MDNRLKGLQKSHSEAMMSIINCIVLGGIMMGVYITKAVMGTEFWLVYLLLAVIGLFLIIYGVNEIKDINKRQYDLEDMLHTTVYEFIDKDVQCLKEEIKKCIDELEEVVEEEKKTTKEVENG